MSSGKDHEKATTLWLLPFSICIAIALDIQCGLFSGIGFFVGGIWLSPDLDTNSKPLKRWGILKILWMPYRKIIKHRSIFSHGPFIGSAIRILYLTSITALIIWIANPLTQTSLFLIAKQIISQKINENPKEFICFLIGIEASAWLHLIKDGDPMPISHTKKNK